MLLSAIAEYAASPPPLILQSGTQETCIVNSAAMDWWRLLPVESRVARNSKCSQTHTTIRLFQLRLHTTLYEQLRARVRIYTLQMVFADHNNLIIQFAPRKVGLATAYHVEGAHFVTYKESGNIPKM